MRRAEMMEWVQDLPEKSKLLSCRGSGSMGVRPRRWKNRPEMGLTRERSGRLKCRLGAFAPYHCTQNHDTSRLALIDDRRQLSRPHSRGPQFPQARYSLLRITTLLKDARALSSIADELTAYYKDSRSPKSSALNRAGSFSADTGEPA